MEFSQFCQQFLGEIPKLRFAPSKQKKADGTLSKRQVCINLPFEGSLVTTEDFDPNLEMFIYDNIAKGCEKGVDYILSNKSGSTMEIDLSPYKD